MAERNSMTVAELVAKVRDGRLECRRRQARAPAAPAG